MKIIKVFKNVEKMAPSFQILGDAISFDDGNSNTFSPKGDYFVSYLSGGGVFGTFYRRTDRSKTGASSNRS